MRLTFLSWIKDIIHGINPSTGEPEYIETDANNRLNVAAIISGGYGWFSHAVHTESIAVTSVSPAVDWSSWFSVEFSPFTVWFAPVGCDLEHFAFEYDFEGSGAATFQTPLTSFSVPLVAGTDHIFPYVGCDASEVDDPSSIDAQQTIRARRMRIGFAKTLASPNGSVDVRVVGASFS